jgi:hypothetical protein
MSYGFLRVILQSVIPDDIIAKVYLNNPYKNTPNPYLQKTTLNITKSQFDAGVIINGVIFVCNDVYYVQSA